LLLLAACRSYKSAVSFYVALTDLLKASKGSNAYYSSKELAVPGLSILPDVLQQQQQQHRTGRSPGEMFTLMNKALATVGRSFVKETGGTGAAAAAASSDGRRPSSPGDSDGMLYPVGGTKAAVANAMAVAARQWQKPPLVANLEPPRRGSSVLVSVLFANVPAKECGLIAHCVCAGYNRLHITKWGNVQKLKLRMLLPLFATAGSSRWCVFF
jgi:hypothetical protein